MPPEPSRRPGVVADRTVDATLAPPPVPGRLVVATLLAASTLTIMAAAVISPSLPQLGAALGAGPDADVLVRLALTITSLGIAVTALVVGTVSDRVGAVPVLVGGLVVYAVAGVAGAFVPSLTWLLVTRVLLGVGVAGVMTSVSTIITQAFRGERRSRLIGLQQTFASLGGVVFLPLAGWLSTLAWNAPFWIYAAGALVLPLALLAFPPARWTRPAAPPTAPSGDGRAAGRRTGARVALVYVVAALGTLVFFMAPTQLPFLLTDRGVPATTIGVVVAASTASGALSATLFSRVRARLDQVGVTTLSLVLLGVGWLVVGTVPTTAGAVAGVLVGGLGVGLVVPNLNLWVADLVPPARRGRALGGLVSAIFLGQFLSPVLLVPMISALGAARTFAALGAGLAVLTLAGHGAFRLTRARAS
ncbi:MFS transporter [Phycicoccus avicenniae]|uniref:MFS transporter n=1 Tax=Phycicoccus avicenniae TaxID=2828860 RepID=UPI003D2D904B